MSPLATPWDGAPVKPENTYVARFIAAALTRACELPDYTSPDDQPDMLGLTCDEFVQVLEETFEEFPVRTDADLGAAWINGRDAAEECFWTLPATAPAEAIAMAPEEYGRRRDAARLAALQALTPPPDLGAALATALEQARGEAYAAAPDASDPTERFIRDMAAELRRARAKFPGDRIMTIALAEEFGELCKAMLEESAEAVWKEAVQTAVMAARVAIDGDSSVDEWRAAKGLDNHRARTPATGGQADGG
ncbi:hypothetical protein [Roseococcus pinisoli]|uniref:Uncharacterized protein n=1 Tax=Roseococcus pinisoli TaxID=2835040 RepID=A0ABS5QAP1_9PROT|nr:hypothetical protein [Roseococcus pinisoli]MBS7810503.1 hypothetical protein [Roseococcus pinisoli]